MKQVKLVCRLQATPPFYRFWFWNIAPGPKSYRDVFEKWTPGLLSKHFAYLKILTPFLHVCVGFSTIFSNPNQFYSEPWWIQGSHNLTFHVQLFDWQGNVKKELFTYFIGAKGTAKNFIQLFQLCFSKFPTFIIML